MYDLLIAGGGPAGVAAGVYAARKKIKTAFITDAWGGQSVVSAEVKNWIGTKVVSGVELARLMEEHLRDQEDIEILDTDRVEHVEDAGNHFKITTKEGKKFEAKTLLMTTGSSRRKLGVPGEKEFDGRGVAYCSTCDAPIFKDKDVAVIGGGNAGLEAVVDLLPYAKNISLLEYSDKLKGDAITAEKIKKSNKVKIIYNAQTLEVVGDKVVSSLKYKDRTSNEEKKIDLQGVFVEIGSIPNGKIVEGLVDLNKYGEIIVDHKTQQTSHERIWAAGDVSDVLYKQNNISMGDSVKAALNIYEYLNKNQ